MSQNTDPRNVLKQIIDTNQASKFLMGQTCLIVEPSAAFSTTVRACLQELGVPGTSIFVASKFAQAKILMNEKRPTVLITEYRIENQNGFELIEMQEKMHEEPRRIAFVTSKTQATSIIAEAAEGQIDGYLLKPFSADLFKRHLSEIIQRKAEPSPYLRQINLGKSLRDQGEHEAALAEFLAAKKLNSKPSLACFFAGDVLRSKGDAKAALQQFREGRAIQPLHYKCVISEFDLLLEGSNFEQAAMLVPTIRMHFPLTSLRLTKLFQTAHQAGQFEELPTLFDAYREMEERDEALVKTAEAAFFAAGVNKLEAKNISDAASYYDIGLQVAGRRMDYLENVISELLKNGAGLEAEAFLTKALPSDVGTPAYHRLTFRVNQMTMTTEELLKKGRELVFAGHGTPEIFHIVVKSFAEAGKETMAETAIGKAVESFPELRSVLYKVLEDHLPKQAS